MLLCDTEQIGSEWTQERLMMMPAANISASSATPAATAAGSSCSSSSAKLKGSMLRQQHQHDPKQHGAVAAAGIAALKCPRCDSSNTKFCYYNNYSLSQPRHFCKACKRYWTRGGTLRNVPVGGGCRKNKRAKKPSHHQQQPAAAATSTGSAAVAADPPQQQPSQSSATIDLSSFMYSADMNLAAYSSTARTAAYDALELGGLIPTSQLLAAELISNNLADLQQQPAASFLNDGYSTSFGSQAASLLVSSLKQQPTMKAEDYQSSLLLPYDASANLGFLKDVKVEGDNNLNSNDNGITEWQASYPFEANGASDAPNLYWTSAIGGAGGWPEAANLSIAHLI